MSRPQRRWLAVAILVLGVFAHLYVVSTIARQPLDANQQPAESHSLIWPLHNDTVHRIGPGADLFAVYHAGWVMRQGASPYASIEESPRTPYYYPFRYLPVVGQTLGRLLVQFSPLVAYRLWVCILEAMLALFILVFITRTGDCWVGCFGVCILLLSSPYFLELHMGQFTFATLSLFGIGLLLLEPRGMGNPRRWAQLLAALSCSGAVLLKVFPIVAGPALLRHRRSRFALVVILTALWLASVPYFASHPRDLSTFYVANFAQPVGGMDAGNHGLTYLIYRIAKDMHVQWILGQWSRFLADWRYLLIGLTALVVFFSRNRQVSVGAAALILAHFLTYAHVWEHHMSGVIVIGLLLLRASVSKIHQRVWRMVPTLLVVALFFLALPTPFAFFDQAKDPGVSDPSIGWPAYIRWLQVLSKAGPTLMLYVAAIMLLCGAGCTLSQQGRSSRGRLSEPHTEELGTSC